MKNTVRITTTLMALLVALGALGVSPAGAATAHSASGYPGSMTVPKTLARNECTTMTLCTPFITAPTRRVNQSYRYRNYAQKVCVQYRFWRSDYGDGYGSWKQVADRTNCATITAAASSVNVAGHRFDILRSGQLTGYYATDFVVTWYLTSDGTKIGSKTYDYTQTTDYTCAIGDIAPYCEISSDVVDGQAGLFLM